MKTKIFAILTCLCLVGAFGACSRDKDKDETTTTTTVATTTTRATTEATTTTRATTEATSEATHTPTPRPETSETSRTNESTAATTGQARQAVEFNLEDSAYYVVIDSYDAEHDRVYMQLWRYLPLSTSEVDTLIDEGTGEVTINGVKYDLRVTRDLGNRNYSVTAANGTDAIPLDRIVWISDLGYIAIKDDAPISLSSSMEYYWIDLDDDVRIYENATPYGTYDNEDPTVLRIEEVVMSPLGFPHEHIIVDDEEIYEIYVNPVNHEAWR